MRVATWADIKVGAVVRSRQGYEYRVVAGPDVIEGLHCVRATSPGCVGAFYIWKEGIDEGRYTLVRRETRSKADVIHDAAIEAMKIIMCGATND